MAVKITISIDQNSQSVANNTSNVTVTVRASWTGGSYNLLEKSGWLTIDGTKYTFTSPFNTGRTTSGVGTLFTKTVNVKHNSNGTKTLSCSASYTSGVSSGTVAASASKTLTTIPRASSLTASNGTLGTAQTLTISRADSSFKHKITYTCGSVSGYAAGSSSGFTTATSISWTPPLSLASQNTTGTTVTISLVLKTYTSDGTQIGSKTKSITCTIPASVKPSCTIAVTDPTGHSATYGGFVQGLSKFKVVVTPTTSYGSAIASYKTTANGTTYTAASFTTGVIQSSGTLKVSTTVKDKRGRSGSASQSLTVIPYTNPAIVKLSVLRCNVDGKANDQGDYVQVSFKTSVSSMNSLNTSSHVLKYKKSSEADFTIVELNDYDNMYAVDNGTYIFEADTGSSYNIEFSVSDKHNTTTRTTTASTGFVLMHFNTAGNGMGIGKTAEIQNALDIGIPVRHFGGLINPTLEPETDLNDVVMPNTYIGANVSSNNYANCPITSGTFTLNVESGGEDGQVHQIIQVCHKTNPIQYERYYYSSGWGDWILTYCNGNRVLWGGDRDVGYYMTSGHTATLTEPVSAQRNGIVLVFSYYNGDADTNWNWQCFYVPKQLVSLNTSGHTFLLNRSKFTQIGTKYLYIRDTYISGHDDNNLTGTANGITYANNKFVLRYVFGV